MKNNNVIVIGAGVIGSAIALALCRRGYRTLNIDKNPAAGFGSTANSCAVVRFSYSTANSVKLAFEGYHYWKNWASFLRLEDSIEYARYIQCGHLVMKTGANDCRDMVNRYRAIGVPFEEWSCKQLLERVPIFDVARHGPPKPIDDPAFWDDGDEPLAGAIFTPIAGYVNDPQLATANLKQAVEASGGRFLFKRTVAGILRSAGRVRGVKLTDGEELRAGIVVNAAGPHSFVINRMAGVEDGMSIKTRALRREVHHLPSPEGSSFEMNGIIASDTNIGIYLRPEPGNRISVGSADPDCDEKTWIEDPDNFDRNISELQWRTQVFRLSKRIPSIPIPNSGVGVVDLYDVADDWIPIYDRSDLEGFYMAVGTSGNQFKNACAVGAMMAELIDACEGGNDQDAAPLQFTGRYTNLTIDTGAFSRKRHLNTESSFSVRG
ncbi:MAG: FAD-dependent oxidoreductase [Rhodospirillaceae bacterium]|nr:FAD-dependent oxidoreductase [Rhodospirillaceae bacterium]MDE0362508.1 FAD-dependent oxidoreductase [Rhodospirillaceae bacterium]